VTGILGKRTERAVFYVVHALCNLKNGWVIQFWKFKCRFQKFWSKYSATGFCQISWKRL